MDRPNRSRILDVGVDTVRTQEAVEHILDMSKAGKASVVCLANVHMVVTAHENDSLRAAMENAELVLPDGMPLVRLIRRNIPTQERIAGYDLAMALIKRATEELVPISFIGTSDENLAKIKLALRTNFPGIRFGAFYSPPYFKIGSGIIADQVEQLRAIEGGIIFVGLGCPKQEIWMHRMRPFSRGCMIGIGAAFNLISGEYSRAPEWVRNNSLEWMYRLFQEPRKLFKRYVETNTKFLLAVMSSRYKR